MNRRHFLKQLGRMGVVVAASDLLLISCGGASIEAQSFKKWVWLTPEAGLSTETWRARLEKLKEAGVHGLIVQVYGSHQAWYNTPDLPVVEPLLEKLIGLGKETDLEIHAWMWTMPNNNPYHIANNPDWYAVNGNNQPSHTHPAYVGYYRFMCPNNPEVRNFIRSNVKHLAGFEGLAGIHLDYVRLPDVIIAEALQPVYNIVQDREYPEYDYCYCATCRKLFKEQSGIDPLTDLADPSASEAWRQFRYNSVTSLVNGELAPEARAGGKQITAAVFPNWESVRQQWSRWELDAFFPMLYHNFYNAPLEWIAENLEEQIAALLSPKPIYSGLFLPALTPEELRKAAELSMEAGASGVSVFAYNNLSDEHLEAFRGL